MSLDVIIASAFVTFAATNIDDLVILTLLFGAGNSARRVYVGQYLGFGAILAMSALTGFAAQSFPHEWVGLLGLTPLFIGLRGFVRLLRRQEDEEEPHVPQSLWSIAALTLANGGDNIGVYAPMFTRMGGREIAIVVGVYLVLVGVWCAVAQRFVRTPRVAQIFDRWGQRLAPFVFIALGVDILLSAGSLSLMTRLVHHDRVPVAPLVPVAARMCAGGPRDELAALRSMNIAHTARAAELGDLIFGSKTRVIGEGLKVEELTAYPLCPSSSDALVHDRTSRALDALFQQKEAKAHEEMRSNAGISIGCEQAGFLLVSAGLSWGIGESAHGTYLVDERSAKLVVDGTALAHVDLDGDGQRDMIWAGKARIMIRFSGSGKSVATSIKVEPADDIDSMFVGFPALGTGVALVIGYRAGHGSFYVNERRLWNGKAFETVERLPGDFEARYELAWSRQEAVLDDSMFGTFTKLRGALDRCAPTDPSDPTCAALFEHAWSTLALGGIPEPDARGFVLELLGWRPCPVSVDQ